MSLTTHIRPGDAQDAALLKADYDDLDTLASNVGAVQIEDYSVDTRHLTGTFKTITVHEVAGPVTPGAYPQKIAPSGAGVQTTVYNTEPVLIVASCQVVWSAAASSLFLEIQVDGAAPYQLRWTGGAGANTRFHVMMPHLTVGDASGDLQIELVAITGSTNWTITDAQIAVLGVQR